MKKILIGTLIMIALMSLVLSSCNKETNTVESENELNLNTEDNVEDLTANEEIGSNEEQVDVELSDLRQVVLEMQARSIKDMDLTNELNALMKSTFDTQTEWPSEDKLPEDFNPEEIIEIGKEPGLGIKNLHKEGITGKGVKVAIIDQPLLLDHEEYDDKIAQYTSIDCEGIPPQMHGPAVASILVGDSCGVAPEATLYYWAEPSWEGDYIQGTTALDQIIEYNKGKPINERIRVVSVSIGYFDNFDNIELWKEKIKEAEESGIIVVHCSDEGNEAFQGVRCDLYKDRDNFENYVTCYFMPKALPSKNKKSNVNLPKFLYVPIDNRTVASSDGVNDYAFFGEGGLSWGAPYLAGVITLGLQVNPDLQEDQIYKYLWQTGTPFNGGFIVNPKAFIEKVKEIS